MTTKFPSDRYFVAYYSEGKDHDDIEGPFYSRVKAEKYADHILDNPRNSEVKVLHEV